MDNKDKKERIIVPIICLLMSIVLWVFVSNVENTIREYDLNKVPVQLLNLETIKDSKLTLSPNQEFYIDLKLEGRNDIYKLKREDFKITVDVSDYAFKKGANKMQVNIEESPDYITIKNTNNLHVIINLEEISEKTIPIKSEISVTAKDGFFVAPPEINPKEVKVVGPSSLVSRVDAVVVRGEVRGAIEDVMGSYALIPVDSLGKDVEGVDLKTKYADVVIKVSKGRSIPVKINTMGELPIDLKLKSIEGSRKTYEIVGLKADLDQITELQTETIDLSKISDNEELTVKIIIPENVRGTQGEEFMTVKINVIKKITKDFNITFTTKGAIEGVISKPSKETIGIRVTAFEDQIDLITPDKIKVEFNLESFKETGTFEGTPIITLVGLDSSITAVPIEKISFNVKKEPVNPGPITP
ncbi:MAG: CdaR family protein [Clostridium sp.]